MITYNDKETLNSKCYLCVHRDVCAYKNLFYQCRYYVQDYNVKESCCVSCIHMDVCKYYMKYEKNNIMDCNQWKGKNNDD